MPETFWSMKNLLKILGKKSSYPPLGLLTVASLLPENWNKKLIDLNTSSLKKSDIEWADYVFISAMNVQEASAKKLIQFCKSCNAIVVAGGPLFTHEYEKFPTVDHFILNEAEITLPLFLKDLSKNKPQKFYRTNEFADVTQSPLPQWELVDIDKYAYSIVQYSRGCPYMCDFCDVTALFGRRPRTKPASQIITELDKILSLGNPGLILFADDNLIGNKRDLTKNLLPALIEWRRKHKKAPGFATQVTVNLADDEKMMQQMIDAGFRHIFVGIESPEEDSLEVCKKTQNLRRDLLQSVKKLQQFGFIVTGGFIVGFDTDNESIFESQVNFIQESGIVIATVNVLKAPPGTELHDRLQKENRLIEPFDFDENKTNIITKMEKEKLYNGYKYILDSIYSPEMVYERAKVFLESYGDHKTELPIRKDVTFRDVIILLRLIFHVGLVGSYRKYFWKLAIETWKTKRKNIVHAYFFAALIHQFNRLHKKFLLAYDRMNFY